MLQCPKTKQKKWKLNKASVYGLSLIAHGPLPPPSSIWRTRWIRTDVVVARRRQPGCRRPRVHVLDAMRQVASALPGSTRDCSASLPLCQSLQMADVWREERVQMKLSDADACCRRRAFTRTQITRICIFTREGVDFSQVPKKLGADIRRYFFFCNLHKVFGHL